MNATWAGVAVALAGVIGIVAGRVWAGGRREGRMGAILEEQARTNTRQAETDNRLAQLVEDLDDRVRALEHRTLRRRR